MNRTDNTFMNVSFEADSTPNHLKNTKEIEQSEISNKTVMSEHNYSSAIKKTKRKKKPKFNNSDMNLDIIDETILNTSFEMILTDTNTNSELNHIAHYNNATVDESNY